jgi:hypothetical protein
MADNISLNGETIATDQVTINTVSAHVQRVKVVVGADGTYTGDVSPTLPLPVAARHATDAIVDGATSLVPVMQSITRAATGTVIVAEASKKLRILSLFFTARDAGKVQFFSASAAGAALTGDFEVVTDTPVVLPFNPLGWFETASGQLLHAVLTGPGGIDGCVTYVKV